MSKNNGIKHFTRGELKRCYSNFMAIPYCDAWYLLTGVDKLGTNLGQFGWNFDVFFIPEINVCITTGYRNTIDDLEYTRELLKLYEDKAKTIFEDKNIKDYDVKLSRIKALREAFLRFVMKDNNRA